MQCNVVLERKLLQFSTFSALLFALLGIGFGLWMGSLVILFDGAYSLVSLALTVLSLVAAAYIRSPSRQDAARVQKVEPLVIAFKGLVITVMCCISFSSAVLAILDGGRDIDAGLALFFGVINVIGCLATFLVMKKYGHQSGSNLVVAESKQWMMDTVISGAVMVGFILAILMQYVGLAAYSVYADPVMVVIASVYFVIVPLKMMFGALKELRETDDYKALTELR
ncbi:cation transporter [Photobacterium lutimaris]|uniref:Cation transporter n=1 Tax=Photobacterium lutimaris TaxID=388278 RepID=A0A2T3J1T9_9GAMM|nr:cation transporter [Photobacterium lutimaris]PSU35010.1 cation transporter [Photobacterium lutimaris]TDR77367.1 cation efflux family protein [Photobacterium lutimaris]